MKTNVKAKFLIIGDEFIPKVITNELNIEPQKFWVKGQQINNKPVYRKSTCWYISTETEESLDINNQINKLLNILKNKNEILKDLKIKYKLEYLFQVVIEINDAITPAICLDSVFINFANSITAEFEIDLYVC